MIDKPITPSELVAAVRPCLPLDNITNIREGQTGTVERSFVDWTRKAHWYTSGVDDAARDIIGLIWQSCERRGWSIETLAAVPATWVHTNGESNHRADGTSVLSLCAAYAAARRASEEKKP